jgi:hypothetical protein
MLHTRNIHQDEPHQWHIRWRDLIKNFSPESPRKVVHPALMRGPGEASICPPVRSKYRHDAKQWLWMGSRMYLATQMLVWEDMRAVQREKWSSKSQTRLKLVRGCIYMYIFGMRNPFHCLWMHHWGEREVKLNWGWKRNEPFKTVVWSS